ncbi:MAG TPA: hypothetical protein VJ878_00445, partial [Candidatus Izemoplasmatales bacterium]|nr:hypothetical protein [Candidatus Izemoplasmatales bacterium]
MQDYNINVKYDFTQGAKETNATSTYRRKNKKTSYKTKDDMKNDGMNLGTIRKLTGVGLGAAAKINQYVGELTENGIQQRNTQKALTLAGLGLFAMSNPVLASIGAVGFVGNSAINYQIKQYKSNLSADFMKSLSGGI